MPDMQNVHSHEALFEMLCDPRVTFRVASHERSATDALRAHWPEYLIEASLLGTFLMFACVVTALLQHPASPVRQAIPNDVLRRALTGLAMGLTAISLIYSPWGLRSGAHFNPATTLTFYRLGKVNGWDALFYVIAQFLGGALGALIAGVLLGPAVSHANVRFAATTPHQHGAAVAFVAEALISFGLMNVVLNVSNSARWMRLTGVCAGLLVATYITLEAPFSGMSMNPARTLASAVNGRVWTALWVYLTAPPLGMLASAELFMRVRGRARVYCAKLNHGIGERCIFRCRHSELVLQSQN
jgi:aquaporin Z